MSLLELLECPVCRGPYSADVRESDGEEAMEGSLSCRCGSYPLTRGVPRLLAVRPDESNLETSRRFGEEWHQFDSLTEEYENQFLSWIEPVRREDFAGRTVLDAGCGKGRHVWCSKRFGAKTVVGVDLSDSVDVAFRNVGRMEGVHIIQADIYNLPLKPVFDYAYSIGVLHHTPDPAKSFGCVVGKVRPGGSVSAWVYGREGNGWIIYVINPLRRLTSILPLPVTKGIAWVFTVLMQAVLKTVYLPFQRNPSLAKYKRYLPYGEYLCSISEYPFRENFCIVFDHLIPGIAFYISEPEFRKWFEDNRLRDVVISRRYNNSWRGFGRKP